MYFCAKAFFMDLLKLFLESSGICTDSRKVKAGDLFFALRGENFDGNLYAQSALERGAGYAIIDRADLMRPGMILVDDVLKALQDLATAYRNTFDVPVLAITGSNGKTTTKELTAAVISQKYNALVTVGNLNNHIGVPLTLLSAKKENDFFIIEMGANHQGEIDMLCKIAKPNFGMITNIGRAHLEGFGGVEGIKKGKSEMYRYLAKHDGQIFLNNSDDVLKSLIPQDFKSVIGYESDRFSTSLSNDNFLTFNYDDKEVETHLFGEFNIKNIAAAIAIGEHFGVDKTAIARGIKNYVPGNNRSQMEKMGKHMVVKDAYNANPSSVDASLRAFFSMKSELDKGIILGDMLELGDESLAEHQQILELISENRLAFKIFIGPIYYSLKDKFEGAFYENMTDAKSAVQLHELAKPHMILLKGSRGIAVEKILES